MVARCAAAPARSEGPELLPALWTPPADRLEDGARRALLELYAPVVLLAPGERWLPAHVEWYLARSWLEPGGDPYVVLTSGAAGSGRLRPSRAARHGSPAPVDWVTYGHVYRAGDGGLLLQYWFFYPYNAFHRLGDHDADWEHVTVHLDPAGRPRGAWYARHDSNAPGEWTPWGSLTREGAHPVVLSARGSHASYARTDEVSWLDRTCPTTRVERAPRRGCSVWRTWSGATGGIVDLGSLEAPGVRFLRWPGRWGADGGIADRGGGPPGPGFQPGWCSGGAQGCS